MSSLPVLPDPTNAIPEEGFIAVLTAAAHAYPFATVCVVLATLLALFGIVCYTVVKCFRYNVLKDPEAGKSIRLIEKQQQSQKREMARIKKGK